MIGDEHRDDQYFGSPEDMLRVFEDEGESIPEELAASLLAASAGHPDLGIRKTPVSYRTFHGDSRLKVLQKVPAKWRSKIPQPVVNWAIKPLSMEIILGDGSVVVATDMQAKILADGDLMVFSKTTQLSDPEPDPHAGPYDWAQEDEWPEDDDR